MKPIRIGIVGLGNNTRIRHVPAFREIDGVELIAVCNRRPESTKEAATQFDIPKTFDRWEDLVADTDIDAVMIGTWPYLHCPVTLAALELGKHVLTEARMARNLAEARSMFRAASIHSDLITQIVPSPFGLRAGNYMRELLDDGYIGELREFVVTGTNADFADPDAPLHWRQSAALSGANMLTLGILHETLIRWVADPIRVFATARAYVAERVDPVTSMSTKVDRPDSVHVLTELPNGARGIYHLSGTIQHGPGMQIQLYGSSGSFVCKFGADEQLLGARAGDDTLREIDVPAVKQGKWRVERDFIEAIRDGSQPNLTDFETGLRYMEFTEAVERSARSMMPIELPLEEESVH